MEPVLCSIAEAARSLGIGKTKTYELISNNMLECVTIGTRRLVKVASIKNLVGTGTTDRAA
ncbi:excisionase family DNA-binding protein [Croceicoccus sp. Ery15]|uniref:excisionase family DNA-binding protein n=1 Tax=Croceicoccus sp. Ery15 TaxID=1703338 RepID=UPI001E3DA0D5|nr:excisionase family DNA-binding protein [Croceicoccus sp. Ery15]